MTPDVRMIFGVFRQFSYILGLNGLKSLGNQYYNWCKGERDDRAKLVCTLNFGL